MAKKELYGKKLNFPLKRSFLSRVRWSPIFMKIQDIKEKLKINGNFREKIQNLDQTFQIYTGLS